jgi:hypothetical protein
VRHDLNQHFPRLWGGRGGPQKWSLRPPDFNAFNSMCGIHEESCLSVEGGHACGIVGAAIRANDRGTFRRVTRSVKRNRQQCVSKLEANILDICYSSESPGYFK